MAYQTAYLKTYFPNQYMAAFLTFESGAQKVSDWIQYVEDCKKVRFPDWDGSGSKVGVEVRPPDVNLSMSDFSVVFSPGEARTARHGHVRFGLSAVKGVSDKAIEAVLKARVAPVDPADASSAKEHRPFTSLFDFCERVMAQAPSGSGGAILNKTTLEALIKCGAMDALHGRENRAAMIATIEAALGAGQKAAQDKAAGQGGLFMGPGPGGAGAKSGKGKDAGGASAVATSGGALAKVPAWSEGDTLTKEKEVLGFYVSSHPLERFRAWASVFVTATTEAARHAAHDQRVVLAGLVQAVRTIIVKNGRSAGQKMAIVVIEDSVGTIETVLFADCYAQFAHLIVPDNVVFIMGRVDRSRAGMAGARSASGGEDDEHAPSGGLPGAGGGDPSSQNVQIVLDRVVPIDGVPLLPGRMWLRVDAERLNGSGESALQAVADAVLSPSRTHAGAAGAIEAKPSAEVPADKTQTFPIDIVIDTADARVRLEVPGVRVLPTQELMKNLIEQLGEGSIKVVGGMTAELPGARPRGPWKKKVG